jgi:hypothetical protein
VTHSFASIVTTGLVGLQAVQVLFLWVHDWAPLGALNDTAAVRRADGLPRLVQVTVIQSAPYSIGLMASAVTWGSWPLWLWIWLSASYAILFAGELRAWWWPYLVKPEPERAARYKALFGRTHAFLPERNGITPNTLHVCLHACTGLTVFLLAAAWLARAR